MSYINSRNVLIIAIDRLLEYYEFWADSLLPHHYTRRHEVGCDSKAILSSVAENENKNNLSALSAVTFTASHMILRARIVHVYCDTVKSLSGELISSQKILGQTYLRNSHIIINVHTHLPCLA